MALQNLGTDSGHHLRPGRIDTLAPGPRRVIANAWEAKDMKWVTRARPKVDRVACPWLIKKFVDPAAEFLYVPTDQVMEVAQREGATPFDVANVELGHN